jgi:HK97 family phage prohead protease
MEPTNPKSEIRNPKSNKETAMPMPTETKAEKFIFAQAKGFNQIGELEAVASTGALDRDSESIEPEAWLASLPVYRTNPVILATHIHRTNDARSPVIGSVTWIEVRGQALEFRMKFASTPLGQEYETLYREKHMRAFSVGFLPGDGEWREMKSDGKTTKRVWIHTQVDLLEISAVPVPANPEALARARAAAALGLADDKAALDSLVERIAERLAELAPKADLAANGVPPQCGGLTEKTALELLKAMPELLNVMEEVKACLPDPINPVASAPGGPGADGPGSRADAGKPGADAGRASAGRLLAAMNP